MAKETWGVLGVGEGRREEIRGMEKGLIAQKHRDAGRSSQLMQAGSTNGIMWLRGGMC